MDLSSFFTDQTIIIVTTLWVLGMIIKIGTPLSNSKIPMILVALGILFAFGLLYQVGMEMSEITRIVMIGILAAGSAVFTHGAIKDKVKASMAGSEVQSLKRDGIRHSGQSDE